MLSMRTWSCAALFALAISGGCASDASDAPVDPGVPHLGEATCGHDLCAIGASVDAACHTCAGAVCAADPFCCSTSWDGICVLEVETVCGETCPVSCGDGICSSAEDCSSCAADCGTCPSCGNGVCEWGEDCSSCAGDCGACPTCTHDKCVTGAPLAASCDTCTADICAVDSFCCSVSWDVLCVSEVESVCGASCGSGCGNGTCDLLEDCTSCPADCGTCPPPPVCGDAVCNGTEDCTSCPADCGTCPPACGDGTCGLLEDCMSCPADCGTCPPPPVCGDGTCNGTEDCATCPADCGGCSGSCTVFGTDSFGYVGCVDTLGAVPPCEDITTTGTVACAMDDCSTTVTLPFSFDFYGTAEATVGFISNGKLGFPGTTTYTNSCTIETNTIAAYWDDLYPPSGGALRYQTFGAAPNRHVTFQWNVNHISGGTHYDVRAVLYEGSSNIDLCYVDTATLGATTDSGASATAGIRGGTAAGLSYSCNMPLLTSGTLLRFTHPGGGGSCGDGTCSFFEDCASCPADCGTCAPACGDGTCNGIEDCASCPGDCGVCPPVCGDGTCNGSEDCASCPVDCGTCPPPPACSDGIDNDGDAIADYPSDPGCGSAADTDETDDCPSGPGCPQCSDGIDNDGDGLTDWPADDSCGSASDVSEACAVFGTDSFGYTGCVDAAPAILPCEDLAGSGTATAGCAGDDCSTTVTLPFAFDYYGTAEATVGFVSNGKLGFPGTTAYSNSCTVENNTIAAFWDDLYPPAGGALRYETFGTAPDRHITFQWNVPHIMGGGLFDVRAVLYEATGDIDLCYADVDVGVPAVDFGVSATVGIEGAGVGLGYSCNTPTLTNGSVVHFDHP